MKFIRLRLTNYRGINNSELEFARDGLTIIEGPNEAGKTSHVEAIRLLFDYKDNTKNAEVKAIKPVDKDVGSKIELEAETGPYVFKYCKQFNKGNQTSLTITQPRFENFTGHDAHQRAEKILEETLDVNLWKALCIQQGEPIQQANLSKQESLSKVLDLVAAGSRSNNEEEGLLEKVKQEYERYFTELGSFKNEILKDQDSMHKVSEEIKLLTNQIGDLEKYCNDIAQAKEKIDSQNKLIIDLKRDETNYHDLLNKISDLEKTFESAQLKTNLADQNEKGLKKQQDDRSALIDKIFQKKEDLFEINENIKALTEQLSNAENICRKSLSKKETALKEFTEVKTILEIHQKDLEYLHKKHQLDTLEHSKKQINQTRKEMAQLHAIACSCKIDERSLNEIKNAELVLMRAKTILNVGVPSIIIRGLSDQDLTINNHDHTISKNEEYHHTISERFCLTIPGTLQIDIVPGKSASDLLEDVQEAQKKLDGLCRNVDVSSADDAKKKHTEKRNALNQYAQQQANEKAQLRGQSYEALENDYNKLSAEVVLYLNNRQTELELPKTIDIAEKKRDQAKKSYEEREKFFKSAEKELDQEKETLDHIKKTHSEAMNNQNSLAMQIKEYEQDLAILRNNIIDEKLQSDLKNATECLKKEKLSLETIEKDLQARQPDRVRLQLKTVQESLKSIEDDLASVQDKKRFAESYIKINGEKGLREQLDVAKTREEHENRAYKSKVRNAEAVNLLYNILIEERDKSRRAYIKPLKDTVEQLGRLVFNHSFEVEISENLMITSRIMDNRNVPFDSLSGGAKEQLSMLSRLACAMMTSKHGMGSLIIDDALGYTDAKRIKSMGCVLASASQQCQIIILTCMPERYHNIGKAKKIELECKTSTLYST